MLEPKAPGATITDGRYSPALAALNLVRSRAAQMLVLAVIWMAALSGGAHATLIFTLTSTSCAGCGSGPWGTVAVEQDPSGTQAIDFTITLNAPYEFHQTHNPQHPVFAIDLNVLNVKFSNFKLNNTATTKVTSAGASGNVPNYGGFPYTLSASSNLVGVLTFTASVKTGTLLPTNVISNGKAYTVIDIMALVRWRDRQHRSRQSALYTPRNPRASPSSSWELPGSRSCDGPGCDAPEPNAFPCPH